MEIIEVTWEMYSVDILEILYILYIYNFWRVTDHKSHNENF